MVILWVNIRIRSPPSWNPVFGTTWLRFTSWLRFRTQARNPVGPRPDEYDHPLCPGLQPGPPVKPQGVWARGVEAWARSRDLQIWSFGGGVFRALQPNANIKINDKNLLNTNMTKYITLSEYENCTCWFLVIELLTIVFCLWQHWTAWET